jgi:hypothetical protein
MILNCDKETLDLASLYPLDRYRTALANKESIYWNYKGIIGKIPTSVLINAVESWEDLIKVGHDKAAVFIYWQETVLSETIAKHAAKQNRLQRTKPPP